MLFMPLKRWIFVCSGFISKRLLTWLVAIQIFPLLSQDMLDTTMFSFSKDFRKAGVTASKVAVMQEMPTAVPTQMFPFLSSQIALTLLLISPFSLVNFLIFPSGKKQEIPSSL